MRMPACVCVFMWASRQVCLCVMAAFLPVQLCVFERTKKTLKGKMLKVSHDFNCNCQMHLWHVPSCFACAMGIMNSSGGFW